MTNSNNKSALPHLEDFLLFIQSNNYSKETLYNYERDLKTFERFLEEEFKGLPFSKVTKRTIEQYKAYLNSTDRKTAEGSGAQKNLKSGSINRNLSSLRRYLSYLIDMDYESPIAPGAIKLLRMEKKHPQVSELEELTSLIEAPMKFEKNKKVALRNRAALETLFASGMRISELISLKIIQLDKTGRIFIEGKGKKQRFVYLTERAKKHIDNYLKVRADDSPFLFIASRGQNAGDKNKHISANYLQMKIKKYRELLGINVPTSAHSLRHGFATYLAEQGANPAAIQILLGHESLDTTTRYVHASDKYAESTHRKFHPLKD
ncbi:MAG: tyrosine-type recombinase/integrase [Candidatus Paceibacterota bacterium]|nr:MAG: tyrosine-type recombinase/integrase [Candidatus Paceibacterota bacterium]